MAIVHPISRLFRSVMLGGLTIAGPIALGLGSASAGEAATEVDAPSGVALEGGPPAVLRFDGIAFGLGALAQMKRERSEFRRVPKMLPLLATSRTANGQLWIGLARGRGGAPSSSGNLRLELCWTIPIGR